jgi:hypothetical protein
MVKCVVQISPLAGQAFFSYHHQDVTTWSQQTNVGRNKVAVSQCRSVARILSCNLILACAVAWCTLGYTNAWLPVNMEKRALAKRLPTTYSR